MEKETTVILEAYQKMYNKQINETQDPVKLNAAADEISKNIDIIILATSDIKSTLSEYAKYTGETQFPVEDINKYLDTLKQIDSLVEGDSVGKISRLYWEIRKLAKTWEETLNK